MPLLMLMVTGPPAETVPAETIAVVVLFTLLNSKVAPPVVPTVSVPGVICAPPVTPSDALLETMMLPEAYEP